MQSLEWYVRRLRSMSVPEVWWRLQAQARQIVDRPVTRRRQHPLPLARLATQGKSLWDVRGESLGRGLPDVNPAGEWPSGFPQWKTSLLTRARQVARHRITLFDLQDCDLGPRINWNYEYKARRETPLIYAPLIDYRSYQETGDCKFVWELSRHYHLVTLARAYRVSGEPEFARCVLQHIDSWLEQCPFGMGMNWRSPLELAIRLINWVWAMELIRPAGLITPAAGRRILDSVYRHLWEISRNYSRYSSANNHLIGEAAGVFIASSYFAGLPQSPQWRHRSRDILLREMARQTFSDGGNREQAFGYHLFVLEFFLLAGLVARNQGEDFPAPFWEHLERMFDFVCGMVEGGEHAPMLGDSDDGYVLDLGAGRARPRDLLAIGAVLFRRGDFKAEAAAFSEQAFWLLGLDGYRSFQQLAATAQEQIIAPRAFPASGYYLLQGGRRGSSDRLSVSFDCGELGMGPIAAHGHADALSFTLRAFGRDILVDPGTYDYFTWPQWRSYFRSTRAHNTVVIDGQDQSEMLGPFLWGRRANARVLRWDVSQDVATVAGEHDGYALLPGRVTHRRTIRVDVPQGAVRIEDELRGAGLHTADLYFHFDPGCTLNGQGGCFTVDAGPGRLRLTFEPDMSCRILKGSEDPVGGWVSDGYHRRCEAVTLAARRAWSEHLRVATTIRVLSPAP